MSHFRRSLTLAGAVALTLTLAACAAASPTSESAPTSDASATSPAVITDEQACADLSAPASAAFNAPNDLEVHDIDAAEYNEALASAAIDFEAIEAPDGIIGTSLANLKAYLLSSSPDPSGAPYAATSDEFVGLVSEMAAHCNEAGFDIAIMASQGG